MRLREVLYLACVTVACDPIPAPAPPRCRAPMSAATTPAAPASEVCPRLDRLSCSIPDCSMAYDRYRRASSAEDFNRLVGCYMTASSCDEVDQCAYACGPDGGPIPLRPADAGTDASTDIPRDTMGDAQGDTQGDAARDAATDTAPDATQDSGVDVPADAPQETGTDAGTDVSTDASADAGTDGAADATADATADVGTDATADAGADAPADGSADAPADGSADAAGMGD